MRESAEAADIRRKKLELLQNHYRHFATFMRDIMKVLGFEPTWMQYDIANYMQYGPHLAMVQAQRGEAKSTIAAIYAVFCLIHDPTHRVLIVSAGGTQASEIATLIQRIILTVPTLECIRPDKNSGDRTSVDAFDVHHSLKGIDKSPSVACIGVTGNLPGKRADLLIADDVESNKNSRTAANRELLLTITLEFSAICTGKPGTPGRILYLGTPQTGDSIYNTLPGRGYDVRIWPGRYPTPAQREHYGPHLAPSIVQRLDADPMLAFGGGPMGDEGQCTDELLAGEQKHQSELRQRGPSSYQLNYMLNTRLMDALRFPLKTENLVVIPGGGDRFPLTITRGLSNAHQRSFQSSGYGFVMMMPHDMSTETAPVQGVHMQIDPAGGGANGDETAFAVTAFLNSTVYVLAVGAVPGGYDGDGLLELRRIAVKYKPNVINIEKNMGYGAFAKVFLPVLREDRGTEKGYKGDIREEFVTGNKEARIIGTLEPVMARGSLVVLESVVEMDHEYTQRYASSGKRQVYSLFHQLAKITQQKGSLAHDDRLDALEGSVRHWVSQLALDQNKAIAKQQQREFQDWINDPTGMKASTRKSPLQRGRPSLLDRYRR
ncbi:DNA packaging protein [Xanthomonas phage f20-Xaj]|uniref:DNA packaging protein n=1 Tax=Xanthomonas phage f20-Xaj TaxID=1784979 RepID=A0A127AVI8_9CAUD|nr:terminase large subunit [Xanthomonas phage f20-Xaj]AMM44666.1 DNA packaging protein [Xanthomonas phage f20-Xaj]